MKFFRPSVASLWILAVTACASASGHVAYVAPTSETVFSTVEEATANPGQIVFVENRSSVQVNVYSVTLRQCENIRGQCSVRPLNVHVDPGQRVVIARVEPQNPQHAFSFRYSLGWRADSATAQALGALASTGDSGAKVQLAGMHRAEERRRHEVGAEDIELLPNEIDALAARAGSLRALPDSLVLRTGARISLDTLRVLLVGKQGEILGRVRKIQWRVPAGFVGVVQPDTLVGRVAGRTAVQLKLADDVLPGLPSLHTMLQVPVIVDP